MSWRTWFTAAPAALVLLTGMVNSALADSDGPDIVGLRLGMTIEEAQKAIKAHNPDLLLQPPVQKIMQYRVGTEILKTDPFVSYIFAVSPRKQKDDVYVYFSAPPAEPRVIAIYRMHNNFDPPITRENYRSALIEKYGAPSATENDTTADQAQRMYWYQWHVGEGTVQCVPHFSGGREVEGQFGTISATAIEKGEVLQRITDAATGQMANPEAKDPSDCAALLTYQLNYDPVFSATGTLIDIAGAAKSERGLSEWMDGLVRQSEDEMRSSTAAPKL